MTTFYFPNRVMAEEGQKYLDSIDAPSTVYFAHLDIGSIAWAVVTYRVLFQYEIDHISQQYNGEVALD